MLFQFPKACKWLFLISFFFTLVVSPKQSAGKQLSTHPPPEEQRLPLLNEVWKVVSKSTDILGKIGIVVH